MIKLGPFTAAEERAIRKAGNGSCLIDAELDPPKVNTLTALRILINVLDGDGNQTGETKVITRSVKLTITEVHPIVGGSRRIDFKVGDWRDLDRFMTRSGESTSPAYSIDREAPKPPAAYVQDLADRARQRDDARRAKERTRETARSLAIRLKDAEKRTDPDEISRIRDELESMEAAMRSSAASENRLAV